MTSETTLSIVQRRSLSNGSGRRRVSRTEGSFAPRFPDGAKSHADRLPTSRSGDGRLARGIARFRRGTGAAPPHVRVPRLPSAMAGTPCGARRIAVCGRLRSPAKHGQPLAADRVPHPPHASPRPSGADLACLGGGRPCDADPGRRADCLAARIRVDDRRAACRCGRRPDFRRARARIHRGPAGCTAASPRFRPRRASRSVTALLGERRRFLADRHAVGVSAPPPRCGTAVALASRSSAAPVVGRVCVPPMTASSFTSPAHRTARGSRRRSRPGQTRCATLPPAESPGSVFAAGEPPVAPPPR